MPFTVLKDITILPTLRALFNFSLVFWMYQLLSSVNDFPVSFHFFPIFTPGAMIIAQAMTSACHSTMTLTSEQLLLPLAISPLQSTLCGVAKQIA